MQLYDSELYMQDVRSVAALPQFQKFRNSSILFSGGTGMIGSFFIDVFMLRNSEEDAGIEIYILGRSKEKACQRFGAYAQSKQFHFIEHDINVPITKECGLPEQIDYVIHAASNTHPVAYASDPIGTISANVFGTDYLLSYADAAQCKRFVFLSSVEIYGENRGDTEAFSEDYLGYIDCNTMRAGYPESKRTGEALCQAYRAQRKLDIVIPRLSRVYGPTMLMSDTKALSQFILKSVKKEDIVLKSEGTQEFSYCYVADCVSAIQKIMLDGTDGEAYNVCSEKSDVKLREIAELLAKYAGKQVIFDLPDAVEQAGYSKATKAKLKLDKIYSIGYESYFDMETGLQHTVSILRELME